MQILLLDWTGNISSYNVNSDTKTVNGLIWPLSEYGIHNNFSHTLTSLAFKKYLLIWSEELPARCKALVISQIVSMFIDHE